MVVDTIGLALWERRPAASFGHTRIPKALQFRA
jgi:hypothetical protein